MTRTDNHQLHFALVVAQNVFQSLFIELVQHRRPVDVLKAEEILAPVLFVLLVAVTNDEQNSGRPRNHVLKTLPVKWFLRYIQNGVSTSYDLQHVFPHLLWLEVGVKGHWLNRHDSIVKEAAFFVDEYVRGHDANVDPNRSTRLRLGC